MLWFEAKRLALANIKCNSFTLVTVTVTANLTELAVSGSIGVSQLSPSDGWMLGERMAKKLPGLPKAP